MNSPFPGMDPYLEPHWLDVHTHLVAYSADVLNAALPEDLIARSQERVAVESEDRSSGRVYPDARIFEAVGGAGAPQRSKQVQAGNGSGVALQVLRQRATERF